MNWSVCNAYILRANCTCGSDTLIGNRLNSLPSSNCVHVFIYYFYIQFNFFFWVFFSFQHSAFGIRHTDFDIRMVIFVMKHGSPNRAIGKHVGIVNFPNTSLIDSNTSLQYTIYMYSVFIVFDNNEEQQMRQHQL